MLTSGQDRWARKALATAASTLFYERAFAQAADAYQRYLRRWPDSNWAWLAAIRRGQSFEALGDWDAAAATYRAAARDHTEPAPAPNQPIGPSVEILALWKQFFPARPGHWGGWVLETYPIVGRITFEDEARSRARVAVGIGYSGCTVHLERTDDGWSVVRLSNFWIT